jgi:hypothetical protein
VNSRACRETNSGSCTNGQLFSSRCGTPSGTLCYGLTAGCTAVSGNIQYPDAATCISKATSHPNTGDYTTQVTSGNTLQCRIYHTSVALQSASSATVHCPHGGPLGATYRDTTTGYTSSNATNGATCGDPCMAYCDYMQTACTSTNAQYSSWGNCYDSCAGNLYGHFMLGGFLHDTLG